MEQGKLKIWLPTIRTGTGSDVFTQRLAAALDSRGIIAEITWFPLKYEVMPFLLRGIAPPPGTDIVFANSWSGFAFKRSGIPLVISSLHPEFVARGADLNVAQYLYHTLFIRRYEKWSFQAADAITAISEYTAGSLRQGRHAHKVEVIPLWLDFEKYHADGSVLPPGQAATEGSHRPFKLLFVGTPSYRKGVDLLPSIMRELGDNFQLRMIGTPADPSPFPANVVHLGRVSESDLIRAYCECDALLFPSRWEGFGYTALEAMACEKPVVTSNATALPEVVEDGVTGILCRSGAVEDFVAACRRLAADPAQAQLMGKAGRERAIELFSEDSALRKFVTLFKRLAAI
ncbi:MAG: glycosyltransferase family 4 protein [Burkholderiaceae bacterium]|nr:glycosyltransferase family 4 protein [Burkholderiaceae bacterium]